ncbi:MAG: hypothetical protein EXR72_00590 [Myxococcales bacterium]|nr:hypothetical protein [Myxococcales bacterium]
MRTGTLVFALAALATLAACGKGITDDSSSGLTEEAAESAALTGDSAGGDTGFAVVATEGLTAGNMASASAAATAAAGFAGTYLLPPGCVKATAAGDKVTYEVTDCTGPYGMVHVSGTVTAVFSAVTASGATVAIAASNLKANGATITVAATVTVTTGLQKTLTVASQSNATGARGGTVTHRGTYTGTWDGACGTLTGTFQTSVAGNKAAASWGTTFAGYKRCKGMCPTAGTIVLTGKLNSSVTVVFTGGATATYTGSGGQTGTIKLACGT